MDDTDTAGQAEAVAAPSGSSTSSQAELAAMLSVTSRKNTRDSLHADIEAFLARGGQIQQIGAGVSAEKDMQ